MPASSRLKSYNFYIVQDNNLLYLVDAGVNTEESWNLFNTVLKENKFTIHDLDFIVLTHHHIDHIGLVNRILSYVDLPIYMNPKAFPLVRRDNDFLTKRITYFKQLYDEIESGEAGEKRIKEMETALKKNKSQAINAKLLPLQGGDTIGSFNVLDAPGHAIDHIVLHHPESGILFAGDNVFLHVNSTALPEPDHTGKMYPALSEYERTLSKLNALNLTIIHSGHGEAITEPHNVIEKRLNNIGLKAERIRQKIGNRHITVGQLAREWYGERYETLFYLITSEIIGHLYRMEERNLLHYEINNGKKYYFVKNKIKQF